MIPAIQKRILAPNAATPAELFVCDACCCGDARFSDRDGIEELQLALAEALEKGGAARQCPAYTTDCMGPCDIGNNVILAAKGRNFFFKKMNRLSDMKALGDWVSRWIKDSSTPLPPSLAGHLADTKKLG